VIASQALITAAFSVTKQAIQLGYLPRLRICTPRCATPGRSTCPSSTGRCTCASCWRWLFGSSSALASAYGIAVTIDMTITTVMTFFVIRYGWKLPLWLCLLATGFFFVVDITFFAANAVKVLAGGWFPLVIGGAMFTLMMTWKQGRALMADRLREEAIDLPSFLEAVFISPPLRVEGTAVFLSAEKGATPFALLHNLKHNKVLHEQNLFVSVQHHEVPWIGFDKRCEWSAGPRLLAGDAALRLQERPRRARGAEAAGGPRHPLDDMETSYFLSRDIVIPTFGGGMALWREKLFASMHRNAAARPTSCTCPPTRLFDGRGGGRLSWCAAR
jgi:KUP system potassium uptake protein